MAKNSDDVASTMDADDASASVETLERMIGAELKRVRLGQHLTIAEVARKCGITGGMLSKLENGHISASLDTLVRLTRALGISLSSLFQGFSESEGGAQLVKKGKGMEVVRRGTRRGHTYQLLASERGPRRTFEPFLITLTDESEVFQRFQHPGTEFIHLLEGRLEYRHGKQLYPMGPGDSLTLKGDIPHGPERLIKLPIRMLSIIMYGGESDGG